MVGRSFHEMSLNLKRTFEALILAASLSLLGCSLNRGAGVGELAAHDYVLATSDSLTPSDNLPFLLQVVDEVNDGNRLLIIGNLLAKTDWDPRTVLVKLTSLNSGQVVGVTTSSLADLLREDSSESAGDRPKSLQPNRSIQFALSVSASGITDYQLELVWGGEAIAYTGKKPQNDSQDLRISNYRIQTIRTNCEQSPCPVYYRAISDLINAGGNVINKVVLGIGYKWVPAGRTLDSAPYIPENEEQLEVPNLDLQPGRSKSVRIVIDKPVPAESDQGSYKPVLRVISFESSQSVHARVDKYK